MPVCVTRPNAFLSSALLLRALKIVQLASAFLPRLLLHSVAQLLISRVSSQEPPCAAQAHLEAEGCAALLHNPAAHI